MDPEIIIASAAVVIAVISAAIAVISTALQQRHNRNSVLPILDFPCCCSSTTLSVKIKNAGTGPMLVKSLTVLLDGEVRKSVLSCFEKEDLDYLEPYYYSNYGHVREGGRVFTPDQDFPLLYLTLLDSADLNKLRRDAHFCEVITRVIDTFIKIRIEVKYEDIYKGKFSGELDLSTRFSRQKDILPPGAQDTFCDDPDLEVKA